MRYKLSSFCHLYRLNDQVVFYHALNMRTVHVESATTFHVHEDYIESEDTKLIERLQQAGLIVSSDQDDSTLLQKARAEILSPYVSTAYFFLTKNCNLACRYCFEKQSEVQNSDNFVMSIEVLEAGIRFFSRLTKLDLTRFSEKKTIIFYGGEPFHNKPLLYHGVKVIQNSIVRGGLPDNTRLIIVTNGTLLNDDDILFIRDHNITLTFSLDGDKAASINRVYPDGQTLAWEKATANFRKCQEMGVDLNVACTLTPQTISRQQQVLDYFVHEAKTSNIGFNVILDNDIFQLDSDYADRAAEFVSSSYPILKRAGITENRTQRRISVFRHKHPCLFDCNATGGRQIAIAPNGDVGICHEHIMDKKHFVTTVFDDNFAPDTSSTYCEFARRTPLYMEECQTCEAIGICGGGCIINAERKYHDKFRVDPRFCKQTIRILRDIILPEKI